MHVQAKCQLSSHPCQVQVLELLEGYQVLDADQKNSPTIQKLTTSSLAQMQVPLDMLLNPRPKWPYLEDMHRDVKDLQVQLAMTRQEFVRQLSQYKVPAQDVLTSHIAFIQYWMKNLSTYREMIEQKVILVVQYLLQIPNTLVCLIGIQPNQDALPHFPPVIYPFLQEPRDAKEYAEIADKLKVWRVKFKHNYDLMVEMITSMDKDLAHEVLSAT